MIVHEIFLELSIAITIAALVSMFMKLIKQPLIIGYIITGIVLGPFALNLVHYSDTLAAFSEIGIAFLLFIIGLNLDFNTLKEVGKLSLITGILQVILTFILGYFIAGFLGFTSIVSLYISTALTFSSTIIVVKLLSDKQELDSLYGKIAVGLLLVQDFIVIIILMFLSSTPQISSLSGLLLFTALKVIGVIAVLYLVSSYLLPKILDFVASSQELLFVFGISWVMMVAVALSKLGFSIEIGALFAGISLSSSPFHLEIASKLKPLRDFFIILFFISLGAQMVFTLTPNIMLMIIIFSLFILVAKPLIVISIIGFMGYKKRIGFLTGLKMGQISEFSFILVVLGLSLGHLNREVVSIVTFVGLITIAGSTYLIMNDNKVYNVLSKYLSVFERSGNRNFYENGIDENYKIILFGYNRIGYSLIKSFRKLKKKFLIVDYNPEVIGMLTKHDISYKYGDASDSELLHELKLQNVELIISTIPQLDINLLLLGKVREANRKAIVVMTSHQIDDAFKLYDAGANYVIMPHFLGGEHASALIEKFGTNISKFIDERLKHIEELSKRKSFGHEHPK